MDHTAFNIISALYPEEIIFLDSPDPFQFLIMVILSAQTTDKRVMEVSPALFERYPDAASLAAADKDEVEAIIKPLGFYHAKSRSIIACAAAVAERGSIPETIDELVKLPGVGRKTANCYIGHVLGKGAVIVDTHFGRVARRLGYTSSEDPEKVEKDIKQEFEEKDWFRVSMALNAFGRDVCHSRKPECDSCPVRSYCRSI